MADKPTETTEVAAPAVGAGEAPAPEAAAAERELAEKKEADPEGEATKDETKTADETKPSDGDENLAESATDAAESGDKTAADADIEAKDTAAETPNAKGRNNRRKSTGGDKGKALNRKSSKAKLTHIDAQPGDHFLVKLKGFPAWPAIICDETMLPLALVNSRPVAAAKPDGTYNEAYADGGKRVHDRSFPVMYLYTNEFGWAANTALSELTAEKAKDTISDKMRKDLKAAFELAAQHHSVEHYKDILKTFQEELIALEEAKKEAAATPKKSKKSKAKAAEEEEEEDTEMVDIPKSAKSKKRKAEEDISTPQRTESAKKPKIKLNTSSTPKTANGAGTPKTKDASAAKAAKSKSKKGKESSDKKADTSKDDKMTPEERHKRKEKEVLYLRHKLQRGLLTREQQPVEDDMKGMSDFITMLENFVDLEGSIIRGTKINKVLKAILKLNSIPREEEFHFKDRSQALLDKWNKLLATDGGAANGVNGNSDKKSDTNGVKESTGGSKKADSEKPTETSVEDSGAKDASPAAKTEASEAEEKAEDAAAAEPVAAGAD